jgi:hypothetical protein
MTDPGTSDQGWTERLKQFLDHKISKKDILAQ